MISHFVLLIDQFNWIVSVEVYGPETWLKDPIKIESGLEINHSAMEF